MSEVLFVQVDLNDVADDGCLVGRGRTCQIPGTPVVVYEPESGVRADGVFLHMEFDNMHIAVDSESWDEMDENAVLPAPVSDAMLSETETRE